MQKRLFPSHFYNKLTIGGAAFSVLMLVCELILFGMDFSSNYSNVYHGLFIYTILPPFLILGLLLIPIGALRARRRERMGLIAAGEVSWSIDITRPAHRNAVLVFLTVSALLVVMTAVGSYKAFHYTESVNFCGTTCHKVMKPEYTTYLSSPHARVKCVECHIGAGAGWYVRSKLSGIRQVFKTVQEDYPRPIPVPVHNLRPARETCEECHWPAKLFGAIEQERTYFASEGGEVQRWKVRMLMQVSSHGQKNSGIHAHMFINNKIYYVPDDEKRQKISWIKVVDGMGGEVVYSTKDSPYANSVPPESKQRLMDCMDCHSRPAHRFEAPIPLVDRAMAEGLINPGIPMIKAKAVEALAGKYTSETHAVGEIRASLMKYYKEKQAEYYAAHHKEVEESIDHVALLFKQSSFPEMKARWDAYPDNIGHLITPGCFRCHDGEHKSSVGGVISRDCNSCHLIIGQGPPENMQQNIDGLPFQHPFVDDDSWKSTNCSDCHSGS